MPITISNSRLSLVAGQCFFEQDWRTGLGPDRTPWDFAYYKYTFNQIRGGGVVPNFAFPWRPSQRSTFWSAYLNWRPLGGVGAASAWRALVPFRLTAPSQPKVATDNAGERVFYDVYGYPHGIVAALTIQSPRKDIETLDVWRDRTRRLRLDRPFSVTAAGVPMQAGLNAATALDVILDWHRDAYYGPIIERYGSSDPISIGAVIQGDGVNASAPIDKDIHRALYAVTSWPMDWRSAALPTLAERCLLVSDANKATGDALYATGRNRTLWRPGLFGLKTSGGAANRPHTLSCLAHNLLAGAVQAESLRLFAQGFEASATAQKKFNISVVDAVADLLDRMRRGENTYRSSSIRGFIEDPNSKAAVNALLARYKLAQIG
jgi:hypothetical protein